MFKRILVPIDLTKKNLRAVSTAMSIAAKDRSETLLFHVIEAIEGLPVEELQGFYTQLEQNALKKLNMLAEKFRRKGLPVKTAIALGNRVNEIVRCSVRYKASLIVLGSHRLDPEHPGRDWGTISYKISVLSQCPVLLVK
ncbi:MAG: universal stress protein [Acidobacteria bacterium]|nr:universal stress protein [Acidobacteriota bacterium]